MISPDDGMNQLRRVTMRHVRLIGWLMVAVIALAFRPAGASARTADQIASDLSATPLPKVDVASMADPAYAASFSRQRDETRQKRAELILELSHAAPAYAEMGKLLSERWQTLAEHKEGKQAVAEIDAYLSANADAKDKEAGAYLRAQLVIQTQAKDTPTRLAAVDAFKNFVTPEQAGTMVPRLIYMTGRLETDPAKKQQLMTQVIGEYPNSFASRLVRGATSRQEAVGKTMTMAFNDAITGTPIDITDFRGKVVVVDFWAAWCTDCAAEMPYMKKMYADFKDKGVVFIGVSLDLPESEGGLDALKHGVARHHLTWPQYYLGKEWDSDFSAEWGVYAVPAVYVLDQQGKVVSTEGENKLETILSNLLSNLLKTPAS
jgi:thiol-disulfide isomerase/thioredoxin